MNLRKKILVGFILIPSFLSLGEHGGSSDQNVERPVEPEKTADTTQNPSEDVCLQKLIQAAKTARASNAMRAQEQLKAAQARTFIDLVEKGISQSPEGASQPEQNLYNFLQALSAGDPLRDTDHLWHQKGGMKVPENFQNLVVTLERFTNAADSKSRQAVLKEAIDHLGWLTSTNFHVPPVRGSGFTDNRYLHDYAQDWLNCLETQPTNPSASRGSDSSKKAPALRKIGPISREELAETLSQAQKNGYSHVIVRYGNDQECVYCAKLGKELEEEFKNSPGILLVSVSGYHPLAGEGIPQSESYFVDKRGAWKRGGSVLVGAGKSKVLRKEIEKAQK